MVSKANENKRMTIAVFGASSNIGIKFVQEALKNGISIIAFTRNKNNINITKIDKGSIKVIQGDITKRQDVWKVFQNQCIDVTVNFAADFARDFSKAKKVNVMGEKNVLDASIAFGAKRHIYISTIATLMLKQSAYRDTKLKAEKLVKQKGNKIEWIILRYANVLGSKTWDYPFKLILPYLRLGIPKVPTDFKNSLFPYVTMNTAIKATLAAVVARPNQTITVFDGTITIGRYLKVMEKIHNVKISYLPSKQLQILDKFIGKYFPIVREIVSPLEFLAHPPEFENETMKKELRILTRDFKTWIKTRRLYEEAV